MTEVKSVYIPEVPFLILIFLSVSGYAFITDFGILPPQYKRAYLIVFVPAGKIKLAVEELEVYAGVAESLISKKQVLLFALI